jgi:hypothetical protein
MLLLPEEQMAEAYRPSKKQCINIAQKMLSFPFKRETSLELGQLSLTLKAFCHKLQRTVSSV